jgi:hypothetical protein
VGPTTPFIIIVCPLRRVRLCFLLDDDSELESLSLSLDDELLLDDELEELESDSELLDLREEFSFNAPSPLQRLRSPRSPRSL